MDIRRLTTTDGFVAIDLEGAPASVGVVRLAPKILQDGAELLARSVTYSCAAYGLKVGGASAGINTKPEGRDDAVTAFMEEIAPLVAAGSLILHPGTGVTEADLRPLGLGAGDPTEAGRSAVAAAEGALGSLAGRTVTVVGDGNVATAAREALTERGATVGDGGLDAEVDALLVGGKAGVVDHEAAETVRAPVLVPYTPVAVTAKAFAVLQRAGVAYVPDFVALAGPLLERFDPGAVADSHTRVREAAATDAATGDAWGAAVARAEDFLRSWRDSLPFGRPLA